MKRIKIGLIGLGTVGSGVVKTLRGIEEVEIKKIAVKNMAKKRDIEDLDETLLTDDAYTIANDEEIDIVVEVAGGVEPAFSVIKEAIRNKKHIVTANKELLAKKGEELFKEAAQNNVVIMYEAAVAGGIPIIMPIKMALRANKLYKIAGILNGTTNYILTKMSKEKSSYEAVLKEAQELGYAETDPTGDVEGFDASYKLATLATIVFKKRISIKSIYREGITHISADDMEYAKQLGYEIKLIAMGKLERDGADVRVHPMFVNKNHMLSEINGVTNAIMLEGSPIGQLVFSGPGAGEFPTASAVVGDILMIVSELGISHTLLPMMHCDHSENAREIDILNTKNRYYILIDAKNVPGVTGTVGMLFAKYNINLTSIIQSDKKCDIANNSAQIAVLTGESIEHNVQAAIEELKQNPNINGVKNLIRVMD